MAADKIPPFIAFEGIDKCGKGTQSLKAVDFLRGVWGNVVFFREPNERDNHTGRLIRRILQHELPAPANDALQRLFVIDRAEDTVCTVLPGLEHGRPVVADRFALSTIAYGALTGCADLFIAMHREVLGPWLRWPNLTVLMDIPAEVAMQRLARERGAPELFEKLESLAKIRQAYLDIAASSRAWAPDMRVEVINGDRPVDTVAAEIQMILAPYTP
ncbi:MAG TPA: dTMP kinase [Candidatus Paceibacterota bacterium]|nr:dTMP kinase [Candidatus Paceibacterota bacterium]